MRSTRDSLEARGLPSMTDHQLEAQWSNLTCGRNDAYMVDLAVKAAEE